MPPPSSAVRTLPVTPAFTCLPKTHPCQPRLLTHTPLTLLRSLAAGGSADTAPWQSASAQRSQPHMQRARRTKAKSTSSQSLPPPLPRQYSQTQRELRLLSYRPPPKCKTSQTACLVGLPSAIPLTRTLLTRWHSIPPYLPLQGSHAQKVHLTTASITSTVRNSSAKQRRIGKG